MTDHDDYAAYAPLLTITQADIDELGVEGEPPGRRASSVAEFKEKGCFKIPAFYRAMRSLTVPYAAFYRRSCRRIRCPRPPASSRSTVRAPGRLQSTSLGYLHHSRLSRSGRSATPSRAPAPRPRSIPLLLWTPHSLRRAHTVNDNVVSLREAFPQECFMSTAGCRGPRHQDRRPCAHDEPARPGSASGQGAAHPSCPGAVALQDGAWIRIDEETGIDLGGDPNILQAPEVLGSRHPSPGRARWCRWRSTPAR